jgi:hypothetical protein
MPYKIHTVLTDNGIQFTTPGAGGSIVSLISGVIANGEIFWAHAFKYSNTLSPRMLSNTGPPSLGTLGPMANVERMNRTIKDAAVKRYDESHD